MSARLIRFLSIALIVGCALLTTAAPPPSDLSADQIQRIREKATEDIEMSDQEIKKDPTNYGPYVKRGYARLVLRQDEAALQDADQCIQLKPDEEDGYGVRYFALLMLGRAGEAQAAKELLAKHGPLKIGNIDAELDFLKKVRGD